MDKNKLKVLQDIEYQVKRTCGTCINASIKPATDWGTCKIWTYEHLKHTEERSQLSINRYGQCSSHEAPFSMSVHLGGFIEFLEPEEALGLTRPVK